MTNPFSIRVYTCAMKALTRRPRLDDKRLEATRRAFDVAMRALLTVSVLTLCPLGSASAQTLSVTIPTDTLSSPAGATRVTVKGALGYNSGEIGRATLALGPDTYDVVTHNLQSYGTFTISDPGGGLAVTSTSGAIVTHPTDGIAFDLTKLLAVLPEWGALSSPIGLIAVRIHGVGSTLSTPPDTLTFYLPSGTFDVTTHGGESYGTFTIAGTFGSLTITGTTGSVVDEPSASGFHLTFDLTQLLAVRPVWSPLSSPPGHMQTNIGDVGVPNMSVPDASIFYLPAGHYTFDTREGVGRFGTFTIGGTFGALLVEEATGSLIATSTPSGIDITFDLTKLLPMLPYWGVLSNPSGLQAVSLNGIGSTFSTPQDSVTFYLPQAVVRFTNFDGGAVYGTATIAGAYGSLAITSTTDFAIQTPGGVTFDVCRMNRVRVTAPPATSCWLVDQVGGNGGHNSAIFSLPDGTYRAAVCSGGTQRFQVNASGITVLDPGPPNFTFELAPCITDGIGPVASDVIAVPNPVSINTAMTITANVDDSSTGGSTISGAVVRIDGGAPISLTAVDGTFNEVTEGVTGALQPFQEAGVHELCVSGTDSAGNVGANTCILLAVYDASAGFVTGGGWITSPPGAYTPEPSLTGKANFGFVSKYQNGANVPTGQTQFRFNAAGLNFHSTSYQWLVVAGARAQFKGSGTLNGSGNYDFLLTAIDGQLPGGGGSDKFRIKITDGDQVIYDNKLGESDTGNAGTELGGGSVIIHND